jgi:hypothetical protein
MNFRYAIAEGFKAVVVKSLPFGDASGDMWAECRYCQGNGPVTLNHKTVPKPKPGEIIVPVHAHCYESAMKQSKVAL